MSAQASSLTTELTQSTSTATFESLSFEGIVNNFHFIRPEWLIAFVALFIVLYILKKIRYYQSPWQHFLPTHLANALLENSHNQAASTTSYQPRYWLKPVIIGSCIIFALAGPAWQKLPQPVYQLERGAVLIMDMSYSMYATDLKPNRLTRARYKAIDLLKIINEGDVGLIAYAGDAFIISPLTQDVKNIELLLPSLSPDIMPVHGANALAALTIADQTLKNAGHISGDIYWFADDIDNEEMSDVYAWANNNEHKVNILGVGSKNGAPIKLTSGKLLKDNRGAIVIPKLPEARLGAIAKRSRGVYHTMTNDDTDIKALTAHLNTSLDEKINNDISASKDEQQSKQVMQGDQYQEQGPWLLIIILPLLLSYFRRGSSILAITWLMPLTLMFSLTSLSPNSYAAESRVEQAPTASSSVTTTNANTDKSVTTSGANQLWRNLWKTSDQQAQQHYQQEDYQQAAEQFNDSQWQGSAHYKAGDYEQALQAFKQSDSAQALYNQGNSLAQLKKIDEAIEAYKEALKKDPKLSDAKDNLAKLEELKKQQEQQSQENQDSEEQSDSEQQENNEQQENQQKQDGKQQSKDQSQGEQQPSDKQESEQEPNQENKQNEQQDDQQDKQSQDAKKQQQKEQKEKAKQAKAEKNEQQKPGDEKSLAQQVSDSKKQETEQKHQQLLNKVTDDPYLLLRNKMRLEYQKRRHESAPQGVTKKW
ncbi:Tetratricopeptide TPR_1 repeat-containing protein [Colwellia psychrerythraea]|uniref:Tetratricopeptide TPR_1 repeat-containing protein n=2 Tax=Colwellia psychrerythraea TaxID=28229 RepID=A0A099KAS9_COLPS|nr:Tetratricopeptide TPR_1 repeat-containing protein [Colwellia psychrerythraea]